MQPFKKNMFNRPKASLFRPFFIKKRGKCETAENGMYFSQLKLSSK